MERTVAFSNVKTVNRVAVVCGVPTDVEHRSVFPLIFRISVSACEHPGASWCPIREPWFSISTQALEPASLL